MMKEVYRTPIFPIISLREKRLSFVEDTILRVYTPACVLSHILCLFIGQQQQKNRSILHGRSGFIIAI